MKSINLDYDSRFVKHPGKSMVFKVNNLWKYLLLLPGLIWVILFCYGPMYGVFMAFISYVPGQEGNFFLSFFHSKFVGLQWLQHFFTNGDFWRILRNTICTSFLTLMIGMPVPIILAISLNEVRSNIMRKSVQTASYLPHFVSWVITANIFLTVLSADGVVNQLLTSLNIAEKPVLFFQTPKLFWWLMAIANTWKNSGYNAIIYLAAITSISSEIYEAADIDGANRWQRIWHITIPSLMPTITLLFILNIGGMLNAGFEQQLLMQNSTVLEYSDVIDTYAYRYGFQNGMYSYGAAVGLFKSVLSFMLLVTANRFARKMNGQALF